MKTNNKKWLGISLGVIGAFIVLGAEGYSRNIVSMLMVMVGWGEVMVGWLLAGYYTKEQEIFEAKNFENGDQKK